jgi:hypothetical protein
MTAHFPRLALTALLILPAAPAQAQTPAVTGPTIGYVYSRASRSIQPLLGIPGSSHSGAPVLSRLDAASVSPDGRWAYIENPRHASFVSGLSSASPSEIAISGLIGGVERVTWNRSGSYALLYSRSSNMLQRVRFSSGTATADTPLDLSSWGQPAVFALDPSGLQIAFAVPGSGLYLLTGGQTPALISSLSQISALAFDDAGARLYAADAGRRQILEFDSGAGPLPFASLAQADGSQIDPSGIATSGGNRYLLLADRASRAVLVYEMASRTLTKSIPLDFVPTRFDPLSSAPAFVLNGENRGEWLLVLDGRDIPNVYFVPASHREGR